MKMNKKLHLGRETLRRLNSRALRGAVGALTFNTCSDMCGDGGDTGGGGGGGGGSLDPSFQPSCTGCPTGISASYANVNTCRCPGNYG